MAQRCYIRAVASAAVLPKAFQITGKGVNRVKVGTGLWDRAPINDYHAQGVPPSTVKNTWVNFVDVFVGDPANPKPELDESGVWSLVLKADGSAFTQPSPFDPATTVNLLEKVETVRNNFT